MVGGSDIFLSYEKSDLPRAKKLADAFEQEGWSVWWDHKIPPGKGWAEVIENSIRSSRCVVVLWSTSSVKSKWVNKEARFADKLERLVPALIDPTELPFEFEHVQAANLTDWRGPRTEGFADLVAELQSRLKSIPALTDRAATNETAAPLGKRRTPRTQVNTDVGVLTKRVAVQPPRRNGPAWIPSRQIGSKVAPTFRASTTGRLLGFVAAIGAIWGAGILAGYVLARIPSSLHVPIVNAAASSWSHRAPWLPGVIALVVEALIVRLTWVIADSESPIGTMDYVLISAKAVGLALVFAFCLTIAIGGAIQAGWLQNFVLIAVSTAALTTGAYAVMDEIF